MIGWRVAVINQGEVGNFQAGRDLRNGEKTGKVNERFNTQFLGDFLKVSLIGPPASNQKLGLGNLIMNFFKSMKNWFQIAGYIEVGGENQDGFLGRGPVKREGFWWQVFRV